MTKAIGEIWCWLDWMYRKKSLSFFSLLHFTWYLFTLLYTYLASFTRKKKDWFQRLDVCVCVPLLRWELDLSKMIYDHFVVFLFLSSLGNFFENRFDFRGKTVYKYWEHERRTLLGASECFNEKQSTLYAHREKEKATTKNKQTIIYQVLFFFLFEIKWNEITHT